MSGQYIHRVPRTPPHRCSPPAPNYRDSDDSDAPRRGDLWLCECGNAFVCKGYGNCLSYDSAQWRRKRLLWGKRPKETKE